MRWLNDTDLFLNPEEKEPNKRIIFRQVGWLGFSGSFYTLEANPHLTERGGFSPIFIHIAQ